MKDDILISIIIPVYNAGLVLAETIESVINQSYNNIEIIIVNDASTDSSVSIIEKFEDERIKLISLLTNIGASACRNLGIINSKGGYFQFLDADDIIPSDKLELQIALIKRFESTMLLGCYWTRFKTDIKTTIGPINPINIQPYQIQDPKKWLINRPMMIPHTWLVPKILIDKAGFWDKTLTLNDDGEFFYRIISHSTGIVLSDCTVFYRSFQKGNLSSRNDKSAMVSLIKSVKSYEIILNGLNDPKAMQSIENFYFEVAFACLNKYEDLVRFCELKLSNKLNHYNTNIILVDKLKKIIGLRKAKKMHTLIFKFKNDKNIRKIFGKR